jgi:hypothetical protein
MPELKRTGLGPQYPPQNLRFFRRSGLTPQKTGQVLVRTPQSANDDHMLLGFNPPVAACAMITTSSDSAGDRSAASYALHTQS